MPTKAHKELCARLMVPDSERLANIWEIIADESDTSLLLAMPGTISDLAESTSIDPKEIESRLDALFHKGVVFPADKPQGMIYRPPRHLIQFHDASNQWPEAPVAFFDLWKEFMNDEFPKFVGILVSSGFPAFMRTVPSLQAIEAIGQVEPFEDVAAMIEQADQIAVCRCPCRLEERSCTTEIERCIQLNKGAQYAIERGTGQAISKEQAIDILREAGQAGLVQMVENSRALGKVICNCCSCCCAIIRPARTDPACKPVLAPSRFKASLVEDNCIGDGLCLEVCPMEAIALDDVKEKVRIDEDRCLGCGACLSACLSDALNLVKIRQPDFIPE